MPAQSVLRTQVLVVGGSLVGLSAALFLAWRRVQTIVVEKHRGSAAHPRAIGFTELTMEHFRAVGIEDRIPQVAPGMRLRRVQVESLAGIWQQETAWTPGHAERDRGVASPCTGAAIAQDVLEPILRRAAIEQGASLRPGVELVGFEQTAQSVVARVRDRESGDQFSIIADYMIAADGARSSVREQLGIARDGVGAIRTLRSVLFRCQEAEAYLAAGVQQFEIRQAGFEAFLTHYPDGRWALMFGDDLDRTAEEIDAAILRALGRDMAFEVIAVGSWELAGRIAERYDDGRIFLAGDAAHQLPPTRGGYGANTGIDDAYNLAWKLQMVLAGDAAFALLRSYNDERRPIGWLRHQQTFARPDYRRWAGDALAGETLYSDEAMELGQRVSSTAVVASGRELPPAAEPLVWAGEPGTRVPHLWVSAQHRRVSTVDLFTRGLTLISPDPRWIEAGGRMGAPVRTVHAGTDAIFSGEDDFAAVFGVGREGASLVRPDGIVAWRSADMTDDPGRVLRDVVARIVGRRL